MWGIINGYGINIFQIAVSIAKVKGVDTSVKDISS